MSAPRIIAAGCDWLTLSHHLPVTDEAEELHESYRSELDRRRRRRSRSPVSRDLCDGREYQYAAGARSPFKYLIGHPDMQVRVAPSWSEGGAQVSAEISPYALWTHGVAHMVQDARAVAAELAGDPFDAMTGELLDARSFEYVSRVDVCMDVQGVEFFGADWELEQFATFGAPSRIDTFADAEEEGARARELEREDELRAKERRRFGGGGWRFTGYTFGTGAIIVRIYDKRAEMAVKAKSWVEETWKRSSEYRVDAPIWRVEAQLRREALGELDVDGWNPAAVAAAWRYVVGKWLTFRERGRDKNRSRWPVAATWQDLQTAPVLDEHATCSAVRLKKHSSDADALEAQARGCLLGELAKLNAIITDPLVTSAQLEQARRVRDALRTLGVSDDEVAIATRSRRIRQ